MSAPSTCLRVCVALALLLTPNLAPAQDVGRVPRVQVAAGGGFLTSGAYFTGPGALEVANGDAFGVALQTSLTVNRIVAVVVAAAHARPEGQLTGVPLIGSVAVPGVRLWFADAALRGQAPLGEAARAPAIFAQAGAGIAHYAVATTLLGTAVDEQATNFALALGAGFELPVDRRLSIEVLAKDYIASFESVRDLEAFGVEGRRAHTLLLLVSARFGL
jgi:hypothetical protein